MNEADAIIETFRSPIPLTEDFAQLNRDTQVQQSDSPGLARLATTAGVPRYHPFEVYIEAYTDASLVSAKVRVATGTVLVDEADIEDIATITAKDSSFTVTAGDWVYLECAFDAAGAVTACEIKSGATWTGYPSLFSADVVLGTNTWIHPIAHVRAPLTGKGFPNWDPGEAPQLEAGFFIAQKTNTHLVVSRACVSDTLIYKLIPGQGGKDGA